MSLSTVRNQTSGTERPYRRNWAPGGKIPETTGLSARTGCPLAEDYVTDSLMAAVITRASDWGLLREGR